jgi:hypothetical protein
MSNVFILQNSGREFDVFSAFLVRPDICARDKKASSFVYI